MKQDTLLDEVAPVISQSSRAPLKSYSDHPMARHPGHAKKRGNRMCRKCNHRETSHEVRFGNTACSGTSRFTVAQVGLCQCTGFLEREPSRKR